MNLVQLKYFQAICESKSISRASENLHISQPSLSAAIKELEKEFGFELFSRHHKGVTLTAEGEKLKKLSEGLLSHSDEVIRIMNELKDKRKILRLGVPPMIGSVILKDIYSDFLSTHKEVELEIVEAGRKELSEKLNDNRLDMVFLPHDKPFSEEFSAVRVAQYDIAYCSNCGEDYLNKKSISASDINLRPLVLFKDSFFQTELIKLWFSSSGIEPNVILKTDQLSTMENIIKSKVADGFMFKVLAAENSFSVAMTLENLPPVSVSLVWKKDKILLESMKSFLSWIKKFKG